MAKGSALPGIYIHVPFCSSVCPYCDFAVTIAGPERRAAYVESVERELALVDEEWAGADTLYLGGGTPSALDDDQIGRLVELVRERGLLGDDVWVFMEVNPEDVTVARASRWHRLGVRTVSVGVQSFTDERLRRLGRRHRREQAVRAVDALKAAGVHTVAADLIFGTAGQVLADWRREIETAAALEVDHLSCYQLTVHEGTLLGRRVARGMAATAGDEAQADLYLAGVAALAEAGYEAYEVSNFARGDHHRSRHNQKYWDHTPYLGLGPSAHSLRGRRRWWNRRRVRHWQRDLAAGRRPVEGEEELGDEQLLLETVMLRLRTAAGLDLVAVERRFGVDLVALNRRRLERWVGDGLVALGDGLLRPTPAGLAVADGLAAQLATAAED